MYDCFMYSFSYFIIPGTYDEELLLGSRVLVFSLSAEAPSFAAMVLAAHYMGLRPRHTVLIVQPMDPDKAKPVNRTLTLCECVCTCLCV